MISREKFHFLNWKKSNLNFWTSNIKLINIKYYRLMAYSTKSHAREKRPDVRQCNVFGSWKFQEIRFIHFNGFFVIFSVFSRLKSYPSLSVIISLPKKQKLKKKRSEDENFKFHWDRSNLPEFNGLLCGTKFDVESTFVESKFENLRSQPCQFWMRVWLGFQRW